MSEAIDSLDDVQARITAVQAEVGKRIVGQKPVLNQLLACILCDGNALLEGNPGLAKTLMVRTVADVTDLSFSRIQNTPDLMPSDITGTEVIREDGGNREFIFQEGPVFANVVLADEINRATPKTQAALLEAMEEKQVTAGGTTHKLPDPFFVLATQNPIDQEGSLHPDESVYLNGRLYKADDALELAKQEGELVHDGNGTKMYDIGASTSTLTPDGEMVETDCLIYEIDFEGSIFEIETKTGRQIRVTDNHPFLVNRDGTAQWVKAQDLRTDDHLVQPERVDLPTEEFPNHDTVLNELETETDFTIVPSERVQALLDTADSELSYQEIDDLRIAAGLSKKELAEKATLNYERVLNYLEGANNGLGTSIQESVLREKIEPGDYLESFTQHRIDSGLSDADAGFFIGFLLAEGHVTDTSVSVSQKNLPELLDRWVTIARDVGLSVNVRHRETGREAKISSKPFVHYLRVRYHIDKPEQYLSAPREFKREFLEVFTLSESNFDSERNRITLRQKDRTLVNVLSHLFLAFDIVPWIHESDRIYDIKIQGPDIERYINQFAWPGEPPETPTADSVHRSTPVPRKSVARLIDILGMKYDSPLATRPWYNSYRNLRDGRNHMTSRYFERFLWDVEDTLNHRRAPRIEGIAEDDLGIAAKRCGLSMTDVADGAGVDRNFVWRSYRSEIRPPEIVDYVTAEFSSRLKEAKSITKQLRGIVDNDVFYDQVKTIESEPYKGPVIGLSVPEHHNYLAGLGACGINHNTYPLPEAQADRFMMKLLLDYPNFDEEREIVDRYTKRLDPLPAVESVISRKELIEIQKLTREVPIADDIRDRAIEIVTATRDSDVIEYGASPRASMALVLVSKARALLENRTYVSEDDVAAMAPSVLRHRIVLDFRAERDGLTPDEAIKDLF